MRTACLLPLCLVLMAQAQTPAGDSAALLPSLPGWSAPRAPGRFGPENLYEHINGAAEGFLECDFRDLTTAGVRGFRWAEPDGGTLPPRRCPCGLRDVQPGAALRGALPGHRRRGLLRAGHPEFRERGPLRQAQRLRTEGPGPGGTGARGPGHRRQTAGPAELPSQLQAFPQEGQVAGSQRYLRRNVLGYPFLERAFTSEYQVDGKRLALWIFAPASASQAREMLTRYLRDPGDRRTRQAGAGDLARGQAPRAGFPGPDRGAPAGRGGRRSAQPPDPSGTTQGGSRRDRDAPNDQPPRSPEPELRAHPWFRQRKGPRIGGCFFGGEERIPFWVQPLECPWRCQGQIWRGPSRPRHWLAPRARLRRTGSPAVRVRLPLPGRPCRFESSPHSFAKEKTPGPGAFSLAERRGFEPPNGCPSPDFESGAIDHSATSPGGRPVYQKAPRNRSGPTIR